jgi:hypothetical protein
VPLAETGSNELHLLVGLQQPGVDEVEDGDPAALDGERPRRRGAGHGRRSQRFVVRLDVEYATPRWIGVDRHWDHRDGEVVLTEEVERRACPSLEVSGDQIQLRLRVDGQWCCRLGEVLPVPEEGGDTGVRRPGSVVQAGDLVQVRPARPTGVLKALGELATVDVPLDLDDDDSPRFIQCEDVRNPAATDAGLAGDQKEGLSGERFQVVPRKLLDLLLVEIGARTKPCERRQRSVLEFVEGIRLFLPQ